MSGEKGKIILTSKGLNTAVGRDLICHILSKDDKREKTILLVDLKQYEVTDILYKACLDMGFSSDHIIFSDDNFSRDNYVDYVYVTEGNTFEVLDYMRKRNLPTYIQRCAASGATYIGCSAGAMIAGTDIKLAADFDSNFVRMTFFNGLCLFDGTVIPHYSKGQLQRYLECSTKEVFPGYTNIYSVGNEEALIFYPKTNQKYRLEKL